MEKIKILIPTDFSQQADYAFLIVKRLTEKIPAEIHFLHVLETGSNVTFDSKGEIIDDGESDPVMLKNMQSLALNKLENIKETVDGVVHTHLIAGTVTKSISDFAQKENFDLIVMGTKGSTGLREYLSGSETQHVARKATVPVLSLMCDRSDLEIKDILWVHDFKSDAGHTGRLIKLIATVWNANIHLLHIISGKQHEDEALKNQMRAFANQAELENVQYHLHYDQNVESGVTHFNQMHNMDLVVIGTHGRSGITQLMKSSIAEKLINHLFKPVITYHIQS